MALDVLNTMGVIEKMENYISKVRPPKEIRHKLDINYRIENQSIILFEIRPVWNDKTQFQQLDYAKTTFNKTNQIWKIYWRRANLKWQSYEPMPSAQDLGDVLRIVDEDEYFCFKG
jgi:Protein of unknown function (DUF3024)